MDEYITDKLEYYAQINAGEIIKKISYKQVEELVVG